MVGLWLCTTQCHEKQAQFQWIRGSKTLAASKICMTVACQCIAVLLKKLWSKFVDRVQVIPEWSPQQRRGPRRTGGTVPPKFEGKGPCIRPPNILRSSVVGCARNHEKSEKSCFSCEERVINDI